jgi:hypothetical protein
LGNYTITLTASQPGGSSWPAATQTLTWTVFGPFHYVNFQLNATATDGTALNPGFGLAVNQTNCTNNPDGATYKILCLGGTLNQNFFTDSAFGNRCPPDDLPLQTSAATANCYTRSLAWDPADHVALFAPPTTTVGTTTYTFDHWDTSGQAVACDTGNPPTTCTFQVPQSGINLTAIYTPPS